MTLVHAPTGTLRLCYVDSPWAYFSTADPSDVWGDDWNDAPHDCNAGEPYDDKAPGLVKVAYDADLWPVGAGTFAGYVKDRWGWLSVQQINNGEAPWLVRIVYDAQSMRHDLEIHAGVTLEEFKSMVAQAGGTVYEAAS